MPVLPILYLYYLWTLFIQQVQDAPYGKQQYDIGDHQVYRFDPSLV